MAHDVFEFDTPGVHATVCLEKKWPVERAVCMAEPLFGKYISVHFLGIDITHSRQTCLHLIIWFTQK